MTLTDYEKQRLEQMAKVKAKMDELKLKETATDIVRSSATAAPRATKPRAPRKKRHDGPRRQSGRLQGERPIYNEDILARLVTTADRPRSHAEVAKVLRSLGRGFSEDSSPTGAAPSALVQDVYGSDDEETLQAIREKRCDNKGRGSVYDAKAGICCHFCRQKKLCAEPGCPRCDQRDPSLDCIGKSECSRCHSATGRFCRQCLLIRYGWTLEEVREQMEKGEWICPHCYEEDNPTEGWICNSSICMTRRGLQPTGIAIYEAQGRGFRSVAHFVQAQLIASGAAKKGEGEEGPRGSTEEEGSPASPSRVAEDKMSTEEDDSEDGERVVWVEDDKEEEEEDIGD